MFYLGLISFAVSMLVMIIALIFTIFQLVKHQTALTKPILTLASLSFALHTLSLLSLMAMQVLQDYSISYVVSVVNSVMPTILKMTAIWGGQAGSLFFWGWTLNLVLFLSLHVRRQIQDGWSFLFTALNLLFFGALSLFAENPFSRVWLTESGNILEGVFSPAAGASVYGGISGFGLNPLLRHWGMVIHPPILYFGFALFLVPFCVAISYLIRGESGEGLLGETRLWLLSAWILLTAGIILGSWWSYDVLGWGGYWAWDPVETASLIPWFTSTGLLHSLLLQKQRKIFKRFNFVLILLTYILIIFSILITRAGLLSSVHAFGESNISLPLTLLTVTLFVVSAALLTWRWHHLYSGWELTSLVTRDAAFLYTNVILISLTIVCFYGLAYPLISGIFTGTQIGLDRTFFDQAAVPLFLLLAVLMAVCPLSAWTVNAVKQLGKAARIPLLLSLLLTAVSYFLLTKSWLALLVLFVVSFGLMLMLALTLRDCKSPREAAKRWWGQRSRHGAWFVHAGVLLIALGIVGMEGLSGSIQGTMIPGDKMPLRSYHVEFVKLTTEYENPEYLTIEAELVLWKDGKAIARLYPGQHLYETRGQYISIPDKQSTLRGDFYTLLLDYNSMMGYVTIQASDNPLVNFMWIGALLMVLGAALAASLPWKSLQLGDDDQHEQELSRS
jgi:cytochrome c-type biogenesis protein CcmF